MKAVILDYKSLAPQDLKTDQLLSLPFDWKLYDTTKSAETSERLKNADIVLTNKVVVDKDLLNKHSQIKLIVILATGTNNVDLAAANSLGIPVCNVVDYSTESVAQHTFACLLMLVRRLVEYRTAVENKRWSKSPFFCLLDYSIEDLSDKTLGIIGYGAIGKRVDELAQAFGMNVVISESLVPGNPPQRGRIPLIELLRKSDVVTIHSPLSQYTRNLMDDAKLNIMKETAILLNMGRGGIVDEVALCSALKSGKIMAAAIDVLTDEPPTKDHILLRENLPNLLITPHNAWASRQSRQNLVDQVVFILEGFLNEELINLVNS